MKTTLFLIILLTATVSQASTKSLYCQGHSEAFIANIITVTGPDYFELRNAEIRAAYSHTDFICAGNPQFNKMKCAGFLNGIASDLVEVSFTENGPDIQISFKSLATKKTQTWPCVIEITP